MGRARTGCGKTLAFVLPIVQTLTGDAAPGGRRPFGRAPSVIVLAPTRELAKQVHSPAEGHMCALALSAGVRHTTCRRHNVFLLLLTVPCMIGFSATSGSCKFVTLTAACPLLAQQQPLVHWLR